MRSFITVSIAVTLAAVSGGPSVAAPATAAVTGPARPLSPAEALQSFKLAAGFRIETWAAEPLVQTPVAAAFDPDGRLFVAEMVGYMPDVDGRDERAPTGRVVVLEDTDGDGRADRRTVFLDNVVLPRAVGFAGDGVLIGAPPELIFCRDRNHDRRCDRRDVIAVDYGNGNDPEEDDNGLLRGLDNWIYNAKSPVRLRYQPGAGTWRRERTYPRGQWGLGMDDVGRLYFNTSERWLRADLLPTYARGAHLRLSPDMDVQIGADATVWPGRPSYGTNRGYRKTQLRPDGTLAAFTAACGPTIYRGDQFPPEWKGNAFMAEPAANMVRRAILTETTTRDGSRLSARNAYDRTEFLTSTDERFRPVNTMTAPDGTLFVVDMYRGLIQHKIYLTPYLRDLVIKNELDQPLDQGRIYRIVSTARPVGPPPRLSTASTKTLVAALQHPNGWWRDTAQRLLVDRRAVEAAPALRTMFATASDPVIRLHALFTLSGIGKLDAATARKAAGDGDRFVRLAAQSVSDDAQLARIDLVARTMGARASAPKIVGAKVAGFEVELLERLLARPDWVTSGPGKGELLTSLANAVVAAGDPPRILRVLDLLTAEPTPRGWRRAALLDGVAAAVRDRPQKPIVPGPPGRWSRLFLVPEESVRRQALALTVWATGKPPPPGAETPPPPLSPEDQAKYVRGKELYTTICLACHGSSGLGDEARAPPLVGSEWVLGPPERLALIVLSGIQGPVQVAGQSYNFDAGMPSVSLLEDHDIASILTYVRRETDWGHRAVPVDAKTIARARTIASKHEAPWTIQELTAAMANFPRP